MFFRSALDSAKSRPKGLFNIIRQQTFKPATSSVQASKDLCDNFANFFNNKIAKIELSLDINSSPPPTNSSPSGADDIAPFPHTKPWLLFHPIEEAELVKLISTSKPSAQVLDPIPAQLTKKLKFSLAPL